MANLILTTAQTAGQFLNSELGRLTLSLALQSRNSPPVQEGRRLDEITTLRSGQGRPIPRLFGRMRLGGQLIWADKVRERVHQTGGGGGKGSSSRQPVRREYRYSLSFAIALCEGEISRIGRIWVDGVAQDLSGFSYRLYRGTDEQMPDAAITAALGEAHSPAYRGLAYIVFDDVDLAPYGNRIPQFNFEVFAHAEDNGQSVRAVNIIPGATEFGYDPETAIQLLSWGEGRAENNHLSHDISNWQVSMDDLQESCPACKWVSLVVTWFGTDLRAEHCRIEPRVGIKDKTILPHAWHVAGLHRRDAAQVSRYEGRPAFDGTPHDGSVKRAIRDLKERGFKIMFYPFVMMDIPHGSTRPNPNGSGTQPAYPWRGHITVSESIKGTSAINQALRQFFYGQGGSPSNPRWGMAHMVEHYARLCADAGGVDAFLIGTEMKELSRLSSVRGQYPFAGFLKSLSARVRQYLPQAKISYAADWSEYGAYYDSDLNDIAFPLDEFWADGNTDFIGIDNYLPLSDWRDGYVHLDAQEGYADIYDQNYLQSQIEGGEYYDWYYANEDDRENQRRTPISDHLNKHFVFRQKDIRNWWAHEHYPRFNGVEQNKTGWLPQSKPIWFTELGCPAVDKGSNQPNKFPGDKSSDSGLPYSSSGQRDDLIQRSYVQAWTDYWSDASRNPVSARYQSPMVDVSKIFIWAWDARPYPAFPYATDLWVDGKFWSTGHWLNGRQASTSLSHLVETLSDERVHVRDAIGTLDGYAISHNVSPRQAIEPLVQAFALDPVPTEQGVELRSRQNADIIEIDESHHAVTSELERPKLTRAESDALPRALKLSYIDSGGEYRISVVEAFRPDSGASPDHVMQLDLPFVLTEARAQTIAERLLAEIWSAREKLRINLTYYFLFLELGDILKYNDRHYRITRVNDFLMREIEAEACEPTLYQPRAHESLPQSHAPLLLLDTAIPMPEVIVAELPLIQPAENATLHVAGFAKPWDEGVEIVPQIGEWSLILPSPSIMGMTKSTLQCGVTGRWDESQTLTVELFGGALFSHIEADVLAGANRLAIETPFGWEIMQFKTAQLIAPNRYELSELLRGQFGTDGVMVDELAEDAPFIFLNK